MEQIRKKLGRESPNLKNSAQPRAITLIFCQYKHNTHREIEWVKSNWDGLIFVICFCPSSLLPFHGCADEPNKWVSAICPVPAPTHIHFPRHFIHTHICCSMCFFFVRIFLLKKFQHFFVNYNVFLNWFYANYKIIIDKNIIILLRPFLPIHNNRTSGKHKTWQNNAALHCIGRRSIFCCWLSIWRYSSMPSTIATIPYCRSHSR